MEEEEEEEDWIKQPNGCYINRPFLYLGTGSQKIININVFCIINYYYFYIVDKSTFPFVSVFFCSGA